MSRPCPCQSKKTYDKCCEPYHVGKALPQTCEQLMRSRFTAYAMAKVDYLLATTAEAKRNEENREELLDYCRSVKCVNLKVLKADGGPGDTEGHVHFHASLQVNGKRHLHAEKSTFVREGEAWVYLDGETN
jgi:SEC-C motif-containing protein